MEYIPPHISSGIETFKYSYCFILFNMAEDNRENITFRIDLKVINNFRKYCDQNGLIMSRQVEQLMEDFVKKKR